MSSLLVRIRSERLVNKIKTEEYKRYIGRTFRYGWIKDCGEYIAVAYSDIITFVSKELLILYKQNNIPQINIKKFTKENMYRSGDCYIALLNDLHSNLQVLYDKPVEGTVSHFIVRDIVDELIKQNII